MAQLDATNGPGLQGRVTRGGGELVGRLTRRDSTNNTNPYAAGDSGQKATSDAGHLTDAREVRERQPLRTKIRQTRYNSL